MAKVTTGTWILVCDGEKALLLENRGDEEDANFELIQKELHENPPDREQGASQAGRMADSQGNKSAFQEADFHRLEKERFAKDLAQMLYKEAHGRHFERLVIAADPRTLGELRKELHKEVQDRVIAEIPKDLTGQPRDSIEARVMEAVRDAA